VNPGEITVLILTYNEAPNLARCLEWLHWAKHIVVVDSGSTDRTLAIAAGFPGVRVIQRPFDTHTQQWNFGVGQAATTWVLSLDADYILPGTFANELESWQPAENRSAAFARFRYCIFGRPLRGTLYPPRAVLFRRDRCHYVQEGHTQQLQINGQTTLLDSVIDHDDRKPFSHWLWAQDRYAILEAARLAEVPAVKINFQDRIRRKILFAPALVFFYTLLGKGLILDGWPGWYYVFQRTLAELILSLRLIEEKLKNKSEK
jgi:glycosyltransferase involved in cell wall biosynthesis